MKQKLITYGVQPLYKRKYKEYKQLFIPESNSVFQLRNKGIEVYRPSLNKLRVGIAGIGMALCLCTPATNWALPGILIWGLK